MKLHVNHTDPSTQARTGWFQTDRGAVPTPIFMPVGTRAAVKALRSGDLKGLDAKIILGNTYHLYLRPGNQIMGQMGGLHQFMSWDRPILTDSGGFQVFSLKDLCKVREEGVEFQSHIDGSRHRFTPENVVETQRAIGSDIAMVLDECPPALSTLGEHRQSMERSMRWARRAKEHHQRTPFLYGARQALFGIAQGGLDHDLRRQSAEALMEIGFDGYAIGGLAVGESTEVMYEVVERLAPQLPADQPRYLMGVGTPQNLLECVARGVDMFDCVMPTRNARNGTVFTWRGRLNLRNALHRADTSPIDPDCTCETCANYSRGYIRHLFNVDEMTGCTLATIHNVAFYLNLMTAARQHIQAGDFGAWMRQTITQMERPE